MSRAWGSSVSSAAEMERNERATGRHARLLSEMDQMAGLIHAGRANRIDAAALMRRAAQIIARQEIELRQAIEDKGRRLG